MAKARVLKSLVLINGCIVFEQGEEVYAFWFDAEEGVSVGCKDELPEDSEGWTLHIQEIGIGGEQLWSPNEWDFDYISDDAVEIVEATWQPVRLDTD